ncbi:MAG: hypothetical protein ACYT04_84810, partial [Nostoc sp.]
FKVSPSQEQPLSQFWERGANYLVPLLPTWDSGLGDEGKTSSQSRFFLKLTPMSFFCAPSNVFVSV